MLRIANQIKSPLQYVSLKQVNIESTIRSFAADVTITQIFRNDENQSIVAVYYFPIEEQSAIYNFTARIDDREIVAQLKENREGQIEHSDGTYLLEQHEELEDNFIINIGVLPPSKECIIIISYVTELDLVQGSIIRFVIPASLAPRYTPQKKGIISLLNTKCKYVQSSLYTIQFRCRIEKINGPNQEQYIARLTSPSHHIDIDLSLEDAYIVTFAQQNTYLDRDILLDIKLSDKRANTCVVIESGAAMAAVTPFEEDCYLKLDNNQTNEFIFILDCSGSMKNENKIGLAREAMLVFLKSLPKNSYFNIIKFGTKYTCLFNESTAFYNHINLRVAEKFISQIRADLGGTEIIAPLQWLECHPPPIGRTRQVFLVTDGEVANVSEVLELCRSMASSTRIFSFGLGASPSRSLVKGLARTTNGRFVFIPPNSNIDVYVGEQLQKAIRRCITNVHVEWNLGITVENVPNQLPPAYMNDRLIIYAFTNNQTIPFNHKSSIEIRTDQSHYHLDITDSDRITNNNEMIARLAAKALILELEHSQIPRKGPKQVRFEHIDVYSRDNETNQSNQDIKQRIIDLSLRYNILSAYTTFVGIEKHLNDRNIDMVLREVPIHVERGRQNLSPSRHRATNNNNNRQRDSFEHVQSRYNTSTRKGLSATIDIRFSNLVNQSKPQEHHIRKEEDEIGSMDDKEIVRYLINKQSIDSLWNFESNEKTIEDLTGKSLTVFQSSDTHDNTQILVTVIVMILLETKFMALRYMWEESAEKARQRLIHLLDHDWKKFILLFTNIRIILNR